MKPFAKMVPEVVEIITADINGKTFYMIDLEEGDEENIRIADILHCILQEGRGLGV